jgi:hypothetical protein
VNPASSHRPSDALGTQGASVAIIRVWMEGDSPNDLRIRILSAPDVESDTRVIGITTDIPEACEIVRTWLEAFAIAHRHGTDGTASHDPSSLT